MKNLVLFAVVVCFSFGIKAQTETSSTVTVTLEHVLNAEGSLLASLHSSDTFMKSEGLMSLKKNAAPGETTFTFENVTPGAYAIMILHDRNDNGRMDFESNGMPNEDYAMSNNPMFMGPPTFSDAKFEVTDQDFALTIRF
ncbi:MAG: DUF2141 domain-containing protein [Maribacter sp.]